MKKANINGAEQLAVWTLVIIFLLALAGAFWWLWGAVLPYFWPTGPVQVISPDFWPFVGCVVVVKIVAGWFHGK